MHCWFNSASSFVFFTRKIITWLNDVRKGSLIERRTTACSRAAACHRALLFHRRCTYECHNINSITFSVIADFFPQQRTTNSRDCRVFKYSLSLPNRFSCKRSWGIFELVLMIVSSLCKGFLFLGRPFCCVAGWKYGICWSGMLAASLKTKKKIFFMRLLTQFFLLLHSQLQFSFIVLAAKHSTASYACSISSWQLQSTECTWKAVYMKNKVSSTHH